MIISDLEPTGQFITDPDPDPIGQVLTDLDPEMQDLSDQGRSGYATDIKVPNHAFRDDNAKRR